VKPRCNLVHPHSGKSIDIYASGTADGTVDHYDAGVLADRRGGQRDVHQPEQRQVPRRHRRGDPANLTKLEIWGSNGANNQKWQPVAGGFAAGSTCALGLQRREQPEVAARDPMRTLFRVFALLATAAPRQSFLSVV
jgi:hypothetical protein